MSDTLGRIVIPSFTATTIFPLKTEWAHGRAQKPLRIIHQFGSPLTGVIPNAKIEQRFLVGTGTPRYTVQRPRLSNADRTALGAFWEAQQGSQGAFFYDVPNEDGTFTRKTVYFENAPLTFDDLSDFACSVGLTLVEIPDPATAPQYVLNSTVTRFPSDALATALLDQVQAVVPLVKIRTIEASNAPGWDGGTAYPAGFVVNVGAPPMAYAAVIGNTGQAPGVDPTFWRPFDILISDRRVTVGGSLYLPRLLALPTITQNIDGSSDDVNLSFGNADRVMIQLANDTQLQWARVEYSLYHVGTGIKIDIWAGYVMTWHSDAGPAFTLRASDILSALSLSSPVGTVSRDCRRRYQLDGCPATGALDLVHFPLADGTQCDFGYNSPNGCMAHNPGGSTMLSYGAMYCSPQGVMLRKGSVSFGSVLVGIATVTASGIPGVGTSFSNSTWFPRTSIIADTIFGHNLPEIWHNDDGVPQYGLPVACQIAAGRDEDNYYAALGVVGAGPIGAFTAPAMIDLSVPPDGIKETFVGSNLDGQPNHGFQVDGNGNLKAGANATFGLRQCHGADPADSHDYFSLGRVATTAAGWFTQAADGTPMDEVVYPPPLPGATSSAYNLVYAAGVSFCEMRIQKSTSDPLTLPSQHSMIASVSQGLTALSWTGPGARTTIPGCTNPFWIAINTYLRAIAILDADTATQEATFDLPSVFLGDGTGCAEIADDLVAKIFGTGTEIQFRFMGSIDGRKPVRDWLRAILNSGLGYFTWSFGKLKLGCRINASAAVAYTAGNMLFNSLQVNPVTPRFEKLTVSFTDQEYTFQANTVDYVDKDHAARNRRSQNPLASVFPLSGGSTKSRAGRIGLVRAREELGGINQAEQDALRAISWKTTILSLDTEAGMVASVTDADIPGGIGNFRVESWRLNPDFSIDLSGQTVVPSMYDHTVGPKPTDVQASPVPSTALQVWAPDYEFPLAGDPLFTLPSFGVAQTYTPAENGAPLAALNIWGANPPNPSIGLLFKVRRELVSGRWAQVCASITSVDATHGIIAFGGLGGGPDEFVGLIISQIAHALATLGTPLPILDFTITGNDSAGNYTVTPDPYAAGCQPGDLFTMRTSPTAADATSFTDDGFLSIYNPGLKIGKNKGNLALVIGGKGKGQSIQTVTDNDLTKVSISPGWDVGQTPDATSVIVLLEAVPQVALPPNFSFGNGAGFIGTVPVPNYAAQVVRVEAYMGTAVTASMEIVPFREIYLWGAQGTRTIYTSGPGLTTDSTINAIITAPARYIVPQFAAVPNQKFVISNDLTSTADLTVATAVVEDIFNDGSASRILAPGQSTSFTVHG